MSSGRHAGMEPEVQVKLTCQISCRSKIVLGNYFLIHFDSYVLKN